MSEEKQIPMTIDQAAGSVLDFIMNDELVASIMESFIQKMYPEHYELMKECPGCMTEDEWEDTPEYTLYYAATVEFHSKVLSRAIMGLCQDPLSETNS